MTRWSPHPLLPEPLPLWVQSWAGPGDGWGLPTSITLPPGHPKASSASSPQLPPLPPAPPQGLCFYPCLLPHKFSLLGILFWLERGGGGVCVSGSFLLSHSSSLPQACLSGCFLCQPGSAPASPLLGRQPPSSPTRGSCGLWLSRVPVNASAPEEGAAGHGPQGGGTSPPPSSVV